jgi:hypothetical protein
MDIFTMGYEIEGYESEPIESCESEEAEEFETHLKTSGYYKSFTSEMEVAA